MRRTTLSLLAGIIAILITSPVSGATFVVPSDEILIQKSDRIIEGEVLTTYSRYGQDGRLETVTEISISETFRGIPGNYISLVHPGGVMGDQRMVFSGVPDFREGDQVLLFLTRDDRGEWTTVDLALGKFEIVRTLTGRTLAIREFHEIAGWTLDGSGHVERHREAAGFLNYVAAVAAGGQPAADYFVDLSDRELRSISANAVWGVEAQAGETPNDYTFLTNEGYGWRWNNFSTTSQNFYNRNSQTGINDGGVSALEAALAAWTNDCDSKIEYHYGGVNASASGQASSDGVNGVVFEDVFNEISGSFNCSTGGTLGIGGVWGGGTHSFGGDTMVTVSEGNVVIQDGIDCWSGLNDGRFTQLLVHELGHSLGFRHSNEPQAGQSPNTTVAIMRASLVDNYGSTLQQYDKDAAKTVYAGGSCADAPTDFDNNGSSDILWRNVQTGANAIWLMNGTTFTMVSNLPGLPNTNYVMSGTSDIDGDNDPDILWRNYSNGANAVWVMNGVSYSSIINLPALPNVDYVLAGSGDFDNNGSEDIVWRNGSTGANAIWMMNGASLGSIVNLPTLTNTDYDISGVGDLDGDGDPDILLRNYVNGKVAIWIMNGSSFSSIVNLPTVPNVNLVIQAIADYDGDNDNDIIWRNYTSGANAVWIMNGSSFTSIVNLPSLPNLDYEIGGPR